MLRYSMNRILGKDQYELMKLRRSLCLALMVNYTAKKCDGCDGLALGY